MLRFLKQGLKATLFQRQQYKFTWIIDLVEPVPQESLAWYNSKPFDSKQANTTWMSKINDQKPVSQLSLPGTHDTASYQAKWYEFRMDSQCQQWSTYDQMQAGLRYFDIRIRVEDQLKTCHGDLVTFGPLKDQFAQVTQFLSENKSEFVVLQFQRDAGATWDPSQKILSEFYVPSINPNVNKGKIQAVLSTDIPKTKDLRGKVWLISSFGVNFMSKTLNASGPIYGFNQWPPAPQSLTSNCLLQNTWDVDYQAESNFITIPEKTQRALQFAGLERSPTRLDVNYLSGSGMIHVWIQTLFPYRLARNQQGPNCQLYQKLYKNTLGKNPIGVTLMDFPGYRLIKSIIDCNFK